MKTKFFEKNFTVNHLVDILRGSRNKRVIDSGWDKHPAYKVCNQNLANFGIIGIS